MITKKERKRLKKIIGNEYSSKVLEELNSQSLTNRHGNPYSAAHINQIFNGKRNHEVIEAAIYRAAETAIAKKNLEEAKRREILQSA